jgi:hypothetical protein
LFEGAERGDFSFHAAAIDAGLIKQPAINGNGSPNRSKAIAMALWKATRQSAPLDGPTPHTAPDMPDLAAAITEWEEAQRPPSQPTIEREPNPAPGPETPFPAQVIPCTSCRHPQAAAALREVLSVYVAARRGEPLQTGSTLPRACCQWLVRRPDPRAMIA